MVRTGVHQVRQELRSQLMATGSTMSATAWAVGVMNGSATTMNGTFMRAARVRAGSMEAQASALELCIQNIWMG